MLKKILNSKNAMINTVLILIQYHDLNIHFFLYKTLFENEYTQIINKKNNYNDKSITMKSSVLFREADICMQFL